MQRDPIDPVAPVVDVADVGIHCDAVVVAHLEPLDQELHRVVALLDLWGLRVDDAVPDRVGLGPLAIFVHVVVVLVIVDLAVTVPVVPVLALQVAIHVGAVVVLHELVVHLVLDAVVGQGEWRWWHLAWPSEMEAVLEGGTVSLVIDSHRYDDIAG